MTFLATLLTHADPLYLSEAGTWLPLSAFGPKSPQKLRRFKYEESARGVAEEWARKVPEYRARVERWDIVSAKDPKPHGLTRPHHIDETDLVI